jgi:hypothetical protein
MFGDRTGIESLSKQPDLRKPEVLPLRQPNSDCELIVAVNLRFRNTIVTLYFILAELNI